MKALIFNIQRFSIHDGRGIRTTVFFKGCNLSCKWCANPESLSARQEMMDGETVGKYYTLDELVAEVLKDKAFYDKSGGGVTLSGGEPLLQAPFILKLMDRLHSEGVSVNIETAASVSKAVFSEVIKKSDTTFIDMKHWAAKKHLEGTGKDNAQILKNIRLALSEKPDNIIIRIPVIPGYNSSDKDAAEFSKLLTELGAKKIELLPFHQLGEKKYEKLGKNYAYFKASQMSEQELSGFAGILRSSGLSVQIGG